MIDKFIDNVEYLWLNSPYSKVSFIYLRKLLYVFMKMQKYKHQFLQIRNFHYCFHFCCCLMAMTSFLLLLFFVFVDDSMTSLDLWPRSRSWLTLNSTRSTTTACSTSRWARWVTLCSVPVPLARAPWCANRAKTWASAHRVDSPSAFSASPHSMGYHHARSPRVSGQ